MATILRAINDEGVKYDLDLMEDVPFRLDISAIESGDIGKVFGISSQQLTLPPTKTNNDFFGNLYDIGSSGNTSFIKTVPAQVLEDGIEIFTGKIYLDSVVTDNRGNDLYNVVVVNETVDFNFLIKDTTFADLDFSSLNHAYSYGNITSSWDQTLEGGAVFYPLINYGFDDENPLDTQIKGGGDPRSFSNYNSPIRVDDFKPAIRLRDCLDAIFDSVNYSYTSSFFTSGNYTDDIYLLATKDDKKGISDVNPVSQSFRAYNAQNQDYPAPTVSQLVNFTTESYDNAGNYNGTNTFTAGENGTYQFEINLVYEILGYSAVGDSRFVDVKIFKNGSQFDIYNFDLEGVVQGQINVVTQYYNLSATDNIQVKVSFTKSGAGAETFRVVGSGNTRFKLLQGPTSILGGTVDLSLVYGDISVPEFLQGLIEKFNLVIEPVKNERNVLKIETFNDWVDQGNVKDWTDKIDYNQKWQISHPLQGQPKNIKFTDVEDNIAITQYHKRTTGKVYGVYDYISESDLANGEKTIGRLFAPTPMKGINGAPMTVLPALAEQDDSSQSLKRTAFAPRLLFHNGRQDVLGTVGKNAIGLTQQNRYYFQDENGVVHTETDYGLASHLQATPAVFGETKDLHFGNNWSPGHYNYHQPQFNGVTKNTAFYEYWSFYINELYDIDSRKVVCNVFLEPTEIPQISLNDKIFIDGHYYRINKINGANISKEDSVEVELIKTLPRKLRFPRRRVDVLGDTPVDITVDDAGFGESGRVEYNDFETGAIYTGSALTPAAKRDGFQVYGNEVVWDTHKPVQAKFVAQTNVGLNRLDESADIIDARGDNNVVQNNVTTARIEGSDNTIQSYSKFVTITGTNNTIGSNLERVQITGNDNSISGNSNDSAIIASDNSSIVDSNKAVIIGGQGTGITIEGSNEAVMVNPFNMSLSGSSNPVTVIGGNGVDIIGGNYHVVIGKDNEVSSTLDLNNYRFNTNVLNGTYLDDDVYLNHSGYEVTGYSGSFTYAYSGEGLFKYIYELEYSNVSGSGVATIELPGITSQDQDGRVILFKADDSLGPDKSFYITSVGGTDTFDGRAGIVVDRPYQWIELRAGTENRRTEWRVIRSGIEDTSGATNKGAYGSFYSTQNQSIAVINTPQVVTLNNTFTSNLISLSGSSTIEMDYAGAYSFTYTLVVTNNSNAANFAEFWVKYNGVDYPNSTVEILLPPKFGGAAKLSTTPVTVQLLDIAVNNGDKIELYWRAESTDVKLQYKTFGGAIPASPAVRATIHAV